MNETLLGKLKFPIGMFHCPKDITEIQIMDWISVLEVFPGRLEALVVGLNTKQLDTVYRPGGWTVR